MEIVPYTQALAPLWDQFVSQSKNGTLFHTRQFLSYHPADRFEDRSVLFLKKGKVRGVFAANATQAGINSHSGSTSGGLVVSKESTFRSCVEMYRLLAAQHPSAGCISFRKHEYIFDREPAQEVEFAATRSGFQREYEELSTCLHLPGYALPTSLRNAGARASKKTELVWDDPDFDAFHALLCQNLQKHSATPTHSLAEMRALKARFPSSYLLVTGRINGELACGTWVVLPTHHTAHTFYIALDYRLKSEFPLIHLIASLAHRLSQQGYIFLNFGISTEKAGTILNSGLLFFKERFGGHGVTRTFYALRR